MTDEPTVSMSALRRLYEISARISGGRSVRETMQAVVDGVVAGLGFGVAVVNLRHPDGTFEVIAVAGPPEVRAALTGRRSPGDAFDREFDLADAWGRLRFVPHDRLPEDEVEGWVPDVPVSDSPDAWHPLDALFAPLHSLDGEFVGVLSVDLPDHGMRPEREQREMLEMFAMQAGIAIDTARLTEQLRREEARLREEQARLAASEEALRLAFEGSATGMAMIGLSPPDTGRYLRVNDAYCRITGYPREHLLAGSAGDLVDPDEREQVREMLGRAAAGERTSAYRAERRMRRGDGTTMWVRVVGTIIDPADTTMRSIMVHLEDITERKEAEQALERHALHDPLTGLPNRRQLDARLEMAIERARRTGSPGALLFCDLDRFKPVNDAFGHDAGDEALRTVAARLLGEVRSRDMVARLGGDEFVVVAEDIGADDVAALTRRLGDAMAQPLPGTGAVLGVSIGVAVLDGDSGDAESVLQLADRQMYAAKERARAR